MCRLCLAALGALFFVSGLIAGEPGRIHLVEDFDATWQEDRWRFHNGGEFPARRLFERVGRRARRRRWRQAEL